MKKEYKTKGVCNSAFNFEIENGLVKSVDFTNGCSGNLQAICKLAEGRPVAEVVEKIKGIKCGPRVTSCPDQLALALEQAMKENN